jgi:hypothetical protein
VQFEWLEDQFIADGFATKKATEHSRYLFAGYHGAILLAYSHSDTSLIAAEVTSLKNWLENILRSLA